MNDKTPLATKIVILLLLLVLAALGVIIFQNLNRPKQSASENAAQVPTESYSELPPIRLAQSHVPPTTPSPNRTLQRPSSSPVRTTSPGRTISSTPGVAETDAAPSADSSRTPQSILAPVPVISAAASPEGTGLFGRVTLSGTPPAEKVIDFSGPSEATCGKLHPVPVQTRHYIVGSAGELANVFVYVKEGAPRSSPKGNSPFLDQTGCLYQPYVIGAMTGQKIAFINSDPFMHNVHALPKVPGNQPFNLAQVTKGQINTKKFDQAEVLVRIQCDVHPWMFAYVGVVDNPYFAVTDKDGKFTINNLPPGKYIVEAVHPKAGRSSQEITVDYGQNSNLNFALSVPGASSVKVAANP